MCQENMSSYYQERDMSPDWNGCDACCEITDTAPLAAASPLVAIVFRAQFAALMAKPSCKFRTHYNRGSGVKLTWYGGTVQHFDEFHPETPDESRLWLAWVAACERPDVMRIARNRDFLENMPSYIINRTISVKQAVWLLDLGE
jgi:hypothetical protein